MKQKTSAGLKIIVDIDYDSIVLRHWSEVVVKKSTLKKLSEDCNIEP